MNVGSYFLQCFVPHFKMYSKAPKYRRNVLILSNTSDDSGCDILDSLQIREGRHDAQIKEEIAVIEDGNDAKLDDCGDRVLINERPMLRMLK